MSASGGLGGRGILLLRSEALAAGCADRLRAQGAEPVVFPVIDIRPPSDPERLSAVIDRLDRAHLAIFISPTAVERGLAEVRTRRDWPPALRVAAVGPGTAGALASRGFTGVIAPGSEGDSEALAELPELAALGGRSVIIFRGEGGRQWLADTLSARGATVEYAECYRRARPEGGAEAVIDRLRQGRLHAVCVWSGDAWDNYCAMLGGAAALARALPVFVPHARIAKRVSVCGAQAVVAAGGEAAMIAELLRFFAKV